MKHAVVLDIGSSKVVCLCGGRVARDGIAVYGADIQTYSGYRNGEWADKEELRDAIIRAVEGAQRECNFRIKDAVISVPAPFIKLHVGEGTVDLSAASGKPKRITNSDIDMLMNVSMPAEAPHGYALMHSTPVRYLVDGAAHSHVPLDIVASRLQGMVSHAYVSEAFLDPVQQTLEGMGLDAGACIAAPLAQSLLLIPREKRAKPALLIDVGYEHTDISLVEQDALRAVESIRSGGRHFASDLQYGLEIPMSVAEQIKRRYGFYQDYQDSVELLRTPAGTKQVEWSVIRYIIEERARELCAMIFEVLQDMPVDLYQRPFVHVTGGGIAMMRGSFEYLEEMLGLRISRETPWMPRMSSPNYSSAFGTLDFVLRAGEEEPSKTPSGTENGVLKKIKDFFVK